MGCDGMSVTVKTIICFITAPIYIVNNSQVSFITEGNRNEMFFLFHRNISACELLVSPWKDNKLPIFSIIRTQVDSVGR